MIQNAGVLPFFSTQFMEFHQIKYIDLFYTIPLTYLPLKVCEKAKKCTQKLKNNGFFPKWQAETPKEKSVGCFCIFGTSTYATGVTKMGIL